MTAKGSPQWYRERRNDPPVPQAKLIDNALVRLERDELLSLLRAVQAEKDAGHVPGTDSKTWSRIAEVLKRYPN